MSIEKLDTEDQFEVYLKKNERNMVILHFGANWAPQCKQLNDILTEFKGKYVNFSFAYIEAERLPSVAIKYSITAVPTLIFMKRDQVVKTVKGGNPKDLLNAVKELANVESSQAKLPDIESQIKELISSDPIILFMKGTPEEPKCGFSRKIVQILSECEAVYKTFDILTNQDIREGLKKYSNWPTYPQLYINNELVGGLDIVQEMMNNGELQKMISDVLINAKDKLEDRLKELINQSDVVLFMKGSPDQPKCGFSRKTVEILQKSQVKFSHFDILTDDKVRQGLKEYSKWPTYPQLYSKGELLGGFDIIKELDASNELLSSLSD